MSAPAGPEVVVADGGLRIERVVTSGTFELDGGKWDVDNNVWLIGDDEQVIVVDPAHEAAPILDGVAGREVVAIVCTHAHNDHITAAADVRAATGAPVHLHPGDRVLWDMTYDWAPDESLSDGDELRVAGATLRVIHTPGACAGRVLSVPRGARRRVHGRHVVPGRPRCDRSVVLGRGHAARLDPRVVVHAAGPHHRPDGPR